MDFSLELQGTLTQALWIPVLIALLFLAAWSLLELGGFARETLSRRSQKKQWKHFTAALRSAPEKETAEMAATFFSRGQYPGFLGVFSETARAVHRRKNHLQKVVSDLEVEASFAQARMNFGVRLGPALGLIGTLIPMGPALIGLSDGRMEIIAGSLAAAFSATILGLAISALCYFIGLVRRHWYAQDLADIDYLCNCLHPEPETISQERSCRDELSEKEFRIQATS